MSLSLVLSLILGCPSSATASSHRVDSQDFAKKTADHLVVFVHGLDGDPISTWKSNETGFIWPENLERDVKNIDAFSFGYPTSLCRGRDKLNIPELAQRLFFEVQDKIKIGNYKSVSFIAHSLGGLIVRELILTYDDGHSLRLPVAFVILLGTPNNGSSLARIGKRFCDNPQITHILPGNDDYLANMDNRWRKRFVKEGKQDFKLIAFYEKLPTYGELLVDRYSAGSFAIDIIPIPKNHRDIAKPEDGADEPYKSIRRFFTEPFIVSNQERDQQINAILKKVDIDIPELNAAQELISAGKFTAAQEIVERFLKDPNLDAGARAKASFLRASCYELQNNLESAVHLYLDALARVPDNPTYLHAAGRIHHNLNRYAEAAMYFEKELAIGSQFSNDQYLEIIKFLANAYTRRGNYAEAHRLIEETVKKFGSSTAVNKCGHWPYIHLIRAQLRELWYGDKIALQRYSEGIEALKKCKCVDTECSPEYMAAKIALLSGISATQRKHKNFIAAEKVALEALELSKKFYGENNFYTGHLYNELANIYSALKKPQKLIISYYYKSLGITEHSKGKNNEDYALTLQNIGATYAAHENCGEAYLRLIEAQKILEDVIGPNHPRVADLLNDVEQALHCLERHDEEKSVKERKDEIYKLHALQNSKSKSP